MPRSSRHKSSKHSSRDAKEYYSDSDKDSSFKEKEREKEKDKDRDRRTKDSGSGDKRKLDSKDTSRDLFSLVNGDHSGDYASSKRRKERADDGVGERRSGGAGDDDSRAEKTSRVSSESKSKKREEVEGDEYKKSRSEGKHRESNKKEERKSREGKSEKLIDEGERRNAKQAAEITDIDVKEQVQGLESQSQLEKRSRRRKDGSGDAHKHQEENGETVDRHLLSKNEVLKDERPKDEKYKDEKSKDDYWEVTDKEDRYRDEIQRDERSRDRSDGRHAEKHLMDERDGKEAHRKSKTQDSDREHGHDRERGRDRQRENDSDRGHGRDSDRDTNRHDRDYDRHRDRDHYRDRDRGRDVDHDREQGRRHDRRERDCDHEQDRHDNDGDRDRDQGRDRDGSQLDERNIRHRGRRGRKRSPDDLDDGSDIKHRVPRNHYAQMETKWSSASGSKMESDAERERSMSRSVYADAALGGNQRSSPSSSHYVDNDEHKQLKQEDSKFVSEQRSKPSSKEGTGFSGAPDRGSKYRTMEKSYKIDDTRTAEQSAERSSSSKASPLGFKERSPSSTSFDRRYAKSPRVRRGLDAEDAAWRGSTPVSAKESSVTEDKKILELPSDRPHLDEALQTESAFHNRATPNSSLIPPPLPHRSGHANPPFRGPVEEDNRSNSARYKRSSDLTTGRGPGSAWRGVPSWPSPLPNGFIPFHHGPPHGGFQSMMPQFPSPSMFGVRPSMDMNHPGIPFHIPDGERFSGHLRPMGWQNMIDGTGPSHLHGWDGNNVAFRDETHMFAGSEWDQNRNQIAGHGWDANAEMWKGQNGDVDLSLTSQKEDHPAQVRNADVSEGPESQRSFYENSESGVQVKNVEIDSSATSPAKGSSKSSPEILPDKTAEHPDTLTSDDNVGASPFCVYLSKLDISTELANPDVYAQCMSLLDDQQSDSLLKASKVLVNLKDGGRAVLKASVTRFNSSILSADTSVFQKAMGLYKKQREASNGLAFSNTGALQKAPLADVETREEKGTLNDQVGKSEEPVSSELQIVDTNMQELNGEKLDISAAGSSLEKSEDLVSERGVEPSSDSASELPERVEVPSPDFAHESTEESTQCFDHEKMDEMMSNDAITEDVHGDSLESLDNGNILDQVKETESTH